MTTTTTKTPIRIRTVTMADLFCGAGGTSTGAIEAIESRGHKADILAINHAPPAIATYTANHPDMRRPLCTGIESVRPQDHYQPGELFLLWASPECIHHSVARGGRPINDQSRSTAFCVLNWINVLLPPVVLIENVPEFQDWGPLDSKLRPIKSKKGQCFLAWVQQIEAAGYRVEWRVLVCADYGDPTTRRRLFVQAVRGRRRIAWPAPSHAERPGADMFRANLKPWVPARQIIDWSIEGKSIYERKKPLSQKTIARIVAGLEKELGKAFIVPQHTGKKRTRSVDKPAPTVTTESRGVGLAEPLMFMVPGFGEREGQAPRTHDVNEPVPTVTASKGGPALVEAILLGLRGTSPRQIENSAQDLDQPAPTITAGGIHLALAQPVVVPFDHQGGGSSGARGVDEPVSTISTKARHGVAQFMVQVAHGNGKDPNGTGDQRRVKGVDETLPTVCGARGEWSILEAHLLPQNAGGALRPVSQPVPTVATGGAIALVEAFLVKFFGTSKDSQSINEPLDTVTTKDRHALVKPVLIIEGQRYIFDIRFRMLQPHELAAAQGFPAGYRFAGTKTEQVRQIGNAVPCNTARALVAAVLEAGGL